MITVFTGMLNHQLLPVGMDEVPYLSLPRGCTAPAQHLSLPMQTLGVLSCATPPFWGALSSSTALVPLPTLCPHGSALPSRANSLQHSRRVWLTELEPTHVGQIWGRNMADGKASAGHLQDLPVQTPHTADSGL